VNVELAELAELVARESGIVIKPPQYPALAAALGRAVPELDRGSFLVRARDPIARRELVERLLDEVTVKETTFMRDRRQLETISWHLLLETARASGADQVRVWSAGCATGEEPYTLALLAHEAFAPAPPPVRILATDISGAAIEAAGRGRYRERAVHELEPAQRARWFQAEDGIWTVGERLREIVRFGRHNLVDDPVPPLGEQPFDLIVCRNVMIYFDAPTVERVIVSLEGGLRRDGTLVLGAADALCGTVGRLAASTAAAASPARRVREAPQRLLRRPRGRTVIVPRETVLAAALDAANHGRRSEALEHASALLDDDPLDADAYFLRGLVELESGEAGPAVHSLRRALYIDPSFGLAAFQLGRAHDAAGDAGAARRAYEQALRTLNPDDDRHEPLLQQVDLGDVAAACRARLARA
jgi:chemotaxis protein methyltransferase CheR